MLRLEIGESGREQQQEQRSGGEGSPALEREGSGASFERAASASASDGAYCSVLNVVFVLPPLSSAPARLLHLVRARLLAPCSSALPGRAPVTVGPQPRPQVLERAPLGLLCS